MHELLRRQRDGELYFRTEDNAERESLQRALNNTERQRNGLTVGAALLLGAIAATLFSESLGLGVYANLLATGLTVCGGIVLVVSLLRK